MIYLKENLKYLRKHRGMTQGELADKLELKRSLIGSYEEGRGVPKLNVIRKMADFFSLSMDELLASNLSKNEKGKEALVTGKEESSIPLKILTVVVNNKNEELISIVPMKAAAGYMNGRADAEYMEQLPNFNMPVAELSKGRSYRVFQIKGDSMLPVPPGSYIFCDYVEHITGVREGKPYLLITANEGIVYKRIFQPNEEQLLLKSDNPEYEPYRIEVSTVLEIWRAIGFLTFDLPDQDTLQVRDLSAAMMKMQEELAQLKGEKSV